MDLHSPYLRLMRLHQPTGIWLLMWPCWWSVALASPGLPDMLTLALFTAGAVLMRSAGCIVNDLADRKLDAQVERTRARPLASGELSVKQAVMLLGALLLLSLPVAVALGPQVLLWSIAALPMVAAYPWMKRITWWPQLFLGLTFNWGALMGWAAVRGQVELPAVLLYAGGIFWTLGYDTIYAHQDKRDDEAAGIKSSARRLGAETKKAVAAFYTLACALWAIAFLCTKNQPWVACGALVICLWQMMMQVKTVDLDRPESCRATFKSNSLLGLAVFAACVLVNAPDA